MDDLISRQDAIDALIEWYGCEPNGMDYFKEILAKKSPAHLTQNNRVNSNNALDTISRQAAIDLCDWYDNPSMHDDLKKLPSAQPDIIRCRNCKFASGDSRICMKFDHSPIGELDFCAWAERRTDEG